MKEIRRIIALANAALLDECIPEEKIIPTGQAGYSLEADTKSYGIREKSS